MVVSLYLLVVWDGNDFLVIPLTRRRLRRRFAAPAAHAERLQEQSRFPDMLFRSTFIAAAIATAAMLALAGCAVPPSPTNAGRVTGTCNRQGPQLIPGE